ncbi:MAG: D-glycero-beta-D-manno-heptose-7-phosphate kinase [Acidobacteriota bacterium]
MEASRSTLRVLLVGDVMLDVYWNGAAHRISPEAPVPVLAVSAMRHEPGGAANVAANLATLGSPVTLLAPVGQDEAGAHIETLLAQHGVSLVRVAQAGYATTQKVRCVCRGQQLLRADFEMPVPAAMLGSLLRHYEDLLPEHDLVVLSDYAKGALRECQDLISMAMEAGKPVFVDPKGQDLERYAGATLLKPNLAEFEACVGQVDDEAQFCRKGQALRERLRLDYLMVTRGEDGMSLFSSRGIFHQPSQAREVFDVCGAGDTVLATMAHMVAMGETLHEAMRWANVAAGMVVGRSGTAQVTLDEVADAMGVVINWPDPVRLSV